MPVISFANPKGGSGKTTSVVLLAGELAARGASVAVIDADPEGWISQWGALPGLPDNVTMMGIATEDNIVDLVEHGAAHNQFVLIDLEGTANLTVAHAIGMSDLVIVPAQGTSMDAKGASKTIKLIRTQARLARREIPYAVLLTRVSAAITSRSLRNVREQLDHGKIDVFETSLVERAAYRDVMDFGGLLSNLDPKQVSNLDKAIQNAMEFTAEVVSRLKAVDVQGRAA